MKTGREIIEAIMRRSRILFARFVARMEDTKLPKCAMFGELVGSAGCVGGQEKEWTGCLLDNLKAFGINADQWTTAAPGRGGMAQDGGTRGGTFHSKLDRCRESRAGLWHAVVCPNVTGRKKDRIAQSKQHLRADLLAIVDQSQVE